MRSIPAALFLGFTLFLGACVFGTARSGSDDTASAARVVLPEVPHRTSPAGLCQLAEQRGGDNGRGPYVPVTPSGGCRFESDARLQSSLASGASASSTSAPQPVIAVKGLATWYDAPTKRDSAAGPALREAIGSDWRGQWVRVEANGKAFLTRLTDWCACGDRNGKPTLIDLDDVAFARLAPLSRGVIDVVIEVEFGDLPHLPATDVEEP